MNQNDSPHIKRLKQDILQAEQRIVELNTLKGRIKQELFDKEKAILEERVNKLTQDLIQAESEENKNPSEKPDLRVFPVGQRAPKERKVIKSAALAAVIAGLVGAGYIGYNLKDSPIMADVGVLSVVDHPQEFSVLNERFKSFTEISFTKKRFEYSTNNEWLGIIDPSNNLAQKARLANNCMVSYWFDELDVGHEGVEESEQRYGKYHLKTWATLLNSFDLTAQQRVMLLANFKVSTEIFVYGAADKTLQKQMEKRREESQKWLDGVYNKMADRYEAGYTDTAWHFDFPINDALEDTLKDNRISAYDWSRMSEQNLRILEDKIVSADVVNRDALFADGITSDDKTYDKAYTRLFKAVENSGMAAVVYSRNGAHSVDFISRLASSIEQANTDLSKATGLKGKVAGLNGRVILDISNTVRHLEDTTIDVRDDGYIGITGNWETFAASWFEGLNVVKSRYIHNQDHYNLLDGQKKLLNDLQNITMTPKQREEIQDEYLRRSIPLQTLPDGHVSSIGGLENARAVDVAVMIAQLSVRFTEKNDWFSVRQFATEVLEREQKSDNMSQYFNKWKAMQVMSPVSYVNWENQLAASNEYFSNTETLLAPAFRGYMEVQYADKSIKLLGNTKTWLTPADVPTKTESRQTITQWENHFSGLQVWWNADFSSRLNLTQDATKMVERVQQRRNSPQVVAVVGQNTTRVDQTEIQVKVKSETEIHRQTIKVQ